MNKVEDNVEGMIVITAYKDNTYKLESSFQLDETHDFLHNAIADIEEDNLIGFIPNSGEHLH